MHRQGHVQGEHLENDQGVHRRAPRGHHKLADGDQTTWKGERGYASVHKTTTGASKIYLSPIIVSFFFFLNSHIILVGESLSSMDLSLICSAIVLGLIFLLFTFFIFDRLRSSSFCCMLFFLFSTFFFFSPEKD